MLEVVEQQQDPTVEGAHMVRQRVENRTSTDVPNLERPIHRGPDESRVVDDPERDEIHAARELGCHFDRRLHREARLPRAARARQRDQPHRVPLQQRHERDQLGVAPDQACRWRRQIVRAVRPCRPLEGRRGGLGEGGSEGRRCGIPIRRRLGERAL